MLSKSTFQFLEDIRKNNNREWFQDNKSRYEEAREDFIGFVGELIKGIAQFDPPVGEINPKKAAFRIYRDVRFSKNKDPYKVNMGAHLSPAVSKNHDRAGYYIHVQPGNCFLAGGAYNPPGPWIKAIRQEIDYNAAEFKAILNSKAFQKYFGEMRGEQLKTSPRDYPADHPEIELLRHKSFLAVHDMDDKQLMKQDSVEHCLTVYKALKPFDDFLNRSLD